MNVAAPRESDGERPTGPLVVRVTYDTVWHLGSATRAVRDGFWGVGKLIRSGPEAVVRCSRSIGRRILGGEPRRAEQEVPPPRDGIRSIIVEELGRLQASTGGMTLLDLEKRLRCMAETVEALQKRINKLAARGPVSEADVWKEMNSLESAESLTKDERALLVGVFRRNIALQKGTLTGEAGGNPQP